MNLRPALRSQRGLSLAVLLALATGAHASGGGSPFVAITSPSSGSSVPEPTIEIGGTVIGSPGPQTVFEVLVRTRYPDGSLHPPVTSEFAYDPTALGWSYPVTWNEVSGVGTFSGRARWFDLGLNHIDVYLPGGVLGSPSATIPVSYNPGPVTVPDVVLEIHPVQRSVDVTDALGSAGRIAFYVDLFNTTLATPYDVDLTGTVTLPDLSTVALPMGGVGVDAAAYTLPPGDPSFTSPVDPLGMRFSFALDLAPIPQPIAEGRYLVELQVDDGFGVIDTATAAYWISDRSAKPFRDVTEQAGLGHLHTQSGKAPIAGAAAAVFDYNGDGLTDLFFTNPGGPDSYINLGANYSYPGSNNSLLENTGVATFTDVTAAAGVEGDPAVSSYGIAWGDVDADGDDDLIVANRNHATYVYRNNGDSTFTDVAASSFGGPNNLWNFVPRLGDYDVDGDLDLYIGCYLKSFKTTWEGFGDANRLHRNELVEGLMDPLEPGFPLFTLVSGSGTNSVGNCLAAYFTDLDTDGLVDLAVHNDFGPFSLPNHLFGGTGTDTFTNISVTSGYNVPELSMGAASADFDGDLLPDAYSSSMGRNSLLMNQGGGVFLQSADGSGAEGSFVTEGPGADGVALSNDWGVGIWDYDLDADADLYVAGSQMFTGGHVMLTDLNPDSVFQNDGTALFTKRSEELGLANAGQGRSVLFFDLDGDGDLDVLTSNENESPTLMRNDLVTTNHYLTLEPVTRRSAPGGFNTVFEVLSTNAHQRHEILAESSAGGQQLNSYTFGLGADTSARVEAHWPRGGSTVYFSVPADATHPVYESVIEINGEIHGEVPADTAPAIRLTGPPGALLLAFIGHPSIPGPVPIPGGGELDIFPFIPLIFFFGATDAAGEAAWPFATLTSDLIGFEVDLQMAEYDLGTGQMPSKSGVSTLTIVP